MIRAEHHRNASRARSLFVFMLVVLGITLVVALPVHGQQRELHLSSNADSAGVWVDGSWMGRASEGPFMIPATAKEVVVRPPGDGIWSIDPLRFELESPSEDLVALEAFFDYHYRIESMPSGADVFLGDTGLGRTPLTHRSPAPLEEMIRLELMGYQPVHVNPGQRLWNHVSETFEPVGSVSEAIRSDHVVLDKGPNWVNIAVTASAFAAGALAVHYRTKADNRFDDFGVTGKPSLRDEIRRLDIQSGVALGVMQAGLGFVAIRLAL